MIIIIPYVNREPCPAMLHDTFSILVFPMALKQKNKSFIIWRPIMDIELHFRAQGTIRYPKLNTDVRNTYFSFHELRCSSSSWWIPSCIPSSLSDSESEGTDCQRCRPPSFPGSRPRDADTSSHRRPWNEENTRLRKSPLPKFKQMKRCLHGPFQRLRLDWVI